MKERKYANNLIILKKINKSFINNIKTKQQAYQIFRVNNSIEIHILPLPAY